MSYPVTYYCPHCGAVVEIEREGYLADKSVTPYPLEGWTYADPHDSANASYESVDGIRFVCGEMPPESDVGQTETGIRWTGDQSNADDVENPTMTSPCDRTFYLSFVRFENGNEIEPQPDTDQVRIASDTAGPSKPNGPTSPDGPGGFRR
ncbi:hypothetical protein [Haloquadratum walsbyi]|uniref:DUF7969 domain-containing protein n=1 Tax=Haloquadratum walsbyi J07HQW2 TaxID=1238425 RepID=U1NDF8_9EURY|nr:hypothetical protein [Haloquadratum walsbyi]ERG95000.1 MAG: hypothetical protein J07HQW2_01444 [Haloquadratum walsbyi J07HQW2]